MSLLISISFVVMSCKVDQTKTPIFQIETFSTPCKVGGESNLHVDADGNLMMSWIEYLDSVSTSLNISYFKENKFGPKLEIAKGDDWFVNWADFPSVISYHSKPNFLVAHWLQMSGDGSYDYDIMISQSKDGGINWSSPFKLHRDDIRAEHGFVSLSANANGRIEAVWLDGRNMLAGHGEHEHDGSMTLRSAEFDIDGSLFHEMELDNRVCECCQTDLIQTNDGHSLTVYRDRSEDEIRDMSFVKKKNDMSSKSSSVHKDNWKIAACPVNGPSLASNNKKTACAWYTGLGNEAKVYLAYFNDEKDNFDPPIRVDNGEPIGRVDVEMDENNNAIVSWMEMNQEGMADIRLAVLNKEKKLEDHKICTTSPKRKSGFPILKKMDGTIYLSHTVLKGEESTVELKRIRL